MCIIKRQSSSLMKLCTFVKGPALSARLPESDSIGFIEHPEQDETGRGADDEEQVVGDLY